MMSIRIPAKTPALRVSLATSLSLSTPMSLMTLMITIPNASPATASIVPYPSMIELKNAPLLYASTGSTDESGAPGLISATSRSTPRNTRKSGLITLPIHVVILPGLREKYSTNAKNINVNMNCQSLKCDSPTIGASPIVYETDAHLGIATNGPMER